MDYGFRPHYQNLVILTMLLAWLVWPGRASAQCVWENWSCTPTPEATPTGTITPEPTGTINPTVFAAPEFAVPTSIPDIVFPPAPSPEVYTPIPTPEPITSTIEPVNTPNFSAPTRTPNPVSTLAPLNYTISLSYTTPLTLDTSTEGITGTDGLSGTIGDIGGFTLEVVSYTNYLTGQVDLMQGSEIITVVDAPDWYAPALPRDLANVGWTFETLTDPDGNTRNFSLNSWGSFFGYVASLPWQLVKSLWQLVAYFGPLGLFLAWLFIMFIIVLVIQAQAFIIRFVVVALRVIVRLVEIAGGYLPTGG